MMPRRFRLHRNNRFACCTRCGEWRVMMDFDENDNEFCRDGCGKTPLIVKADIEDGEDEADL